MSHTDQWRKLVNADDLSPSLAPPVRMPIIVQVYGQSNARPWRRRPHFAYARKRGKRTRVRF